MALKQTIGTLKSLLDDLCCDLNKAEKGNKTAAQRVRTSSIKFAKISKVYRKESVASEKKPVAKFLKRATAKLPAKKR